MLNGRTKRKVWVFSKEAKIPRTTAWRTQKKGTEVVGGCTATDLRIATLQNIERDIEASSPTVLESCTDSEKDDLYTAQRAPSFASDGQANDAEFYDEQLNEDPMGEFVSFLVNLSDLVGDSDTSEESKVLESVEHGKVHGLIIYMYMHMQCIFLIISKLLEACTCVRDISSEHFHFLCFFFEYLSHIMVIGRVK